MGRNFWSVPAGAADVRFVRMAKIRPTPRKKKSKARVLTPEQLERRRRWTSRIVNLLGIIAVVGAFSIGYRALAQHVRTNYTVVSAPPALVLVNRPGWMNDRLAGEVAQRLARALPQQGSKLDQGLLAKLNEILSREAWIERVNQVRRSNADGRDTILIDCVYRTPLAIARFERGRETVYQLVDAAGVMLPIHYDAAEAQAILGGQDRSTNLRLIAGVPGSAPAAGARWESKHLRAGLEVAALLHDEPGARHVVMIDVANIGSRSGSQIILWTAASTQIRWGQPPSSTDPLAEATPQAKLVHLRTVADTFGGDYPEWVDIRFDAVKYLRPRVAAE